MFLMERKHHRDLMKVTCSMPFGNLILIIPKMCIVRYTSDSMIVPDNQQEECSDEEEKGSDEGNLFYAIWKPHFNHP